MEGPGNSAVVPPATTRWRVVSDGTFRLRLLSVSSILRSDEGNILKQMANFPWTLCLKEKFRPC